MKLTRMTAIFIFAAIVALLVPFGARASHCANAGKIVVFTYHGFYTSEFGGNGARVAGTNANAACSAPLVSQDTVDTRIIDPDVAGLQVRVILATADTGFGEASGFEGKICGSGLGFSDCEVSGNRAQGGQDIELTFVSGSSSATSHVFDSPTQWVDTLQASGCFTALVSTDKSNDTDEDDNPAVTYELQTRYHTVDSSC